MEKVFKAGTVMVFIINFVRGMAVHRTTRANVRALGEDGVLIS